MIKQEESSHYIEGLHYKYGLHNFVYWLDEIDNVWKKSSTRKKLSNYYTHDAIMRREEERKARVRHISKMTQRKVRERKKNEALATKNN